jgi:hypothetical protein
LSRSTTRQATATITKVCTKMSSSPMRARVNESPSTANKRPATRPSRVEPVNRRPSRARTTTPIVPAIAEGNRQPSEL